MRLLKLVREEGGTTSELEHLETIDLADIFAHEELPQQLLILVDKHTACHGRLQRLEGLILLGCTDLFCSRCNHDTLLYQLFFIIHLEVLIDLAIVKEPQVAMLCHELRPDAVDRIDRAPLEFVEVAGYDFCSLHRIRQHQCDLMSVEKFSEALENTMSHPELREGVSAAVNVSEYSVEVDNDEVLILKSLSSLEQYPASDKTGLRRSRWYKLFGHASLAELDLTPTQLVGLTGLILLLKGMALWEALLWKSRLRAVKVCSRLVLSILLGFPDY